MKEEERKPHPKLPDPAEIEPWHHPGQPTVDEVPEEVEEHRLEAARRQQKMTEDKTGKAD